RRRPRHCARRRRERGRKRRRHVPARALRERWASRGAALRAGGAQGDRRRSALGRAPWRFVRAPRQCRGAGRRPGGDREARGAVIPEVLTPAVATAIALPLALALDVALGDPPNRYHPVAWVGRLLAAGRGLLCRGSPAGLFAGGAALTISADTSAPAVPARVAAPLRRPGRGPVRRG